MNRAIKIVGLFFLVLCPTFLAAQSSESWTLYRELEEVKIDYTVQQCGIEPQTVTEFKFLRLTNKTNRNITISFKIEYYYNGACTTCSNSEYQFSFNLPALGSLSPTCSTLTEDAGKLALINRYVNRNFGYPLDRFELTNIVIQ